MDQRDGLLREAEAINIRLKIIYDTVTELNTRIMPSLPVPKEERPHGPKCGCYYCD